ncbi:MAG TPA: hypothetical protein VNR88_06985, partial [Hyphomicrobium sp.]|nr:hypothetical protein [Hyphomicrobium sp.]
MHRAAIGQRLRRVRQLVTRVARGANRCGWERRQDAASGRRERPAHRAVVAVFWAMLLVVPFTVPWADRAVAIGVIHHRAAG